MMEVSLNHQGSANILFRKVNYFSAIGRVCSVTVGFIVLHLSAYNFTKPFLLHIYSLSLFSLETAWQGCRIYDFALRVPAEV